MKQRSCVLIGYLRGQDGHILPTRISHTNHARKSSLFDHIIYPLLTKLVRSRWLDVEVIIKRKKNRGCSLSTKTLLSRGVNPNHVHQ